LLFWLALVALLFYFNVVFGLLSHFAECFSF